MLNVLHLLVKNGFNTPEPHIQKTKAGAKISNSSQTQLPTGNKI